MRSHFCLGPRRVLVCALAFGSLLALTRAATAVTVVISPDVTLVLGGVTLDDEEVAAANGLAVVVPSSLGTLPGVADLDAYHLEEATGDQLFSLDTTVTLTGPGPLTAGPGDVVRYDGFSYTVEFDASANGVPNGVATDAVSTTTAGDLVLSFDTTVDLGGGLVVDDEDLVSWDGSGFSGFFDGSAAGVSGVLDLDGAQELAGNGHLLLSFDGSGTLGSVAFDDEDVLEYDPGSGVWELAVDNSTIYPSSAVVDLDALHRLADGDGDGLDDALDNCVEVANGPVAGPAGCYTDVQVDTDGDGYGNPCDGDFSHDGAVNSTDVLILNPDLGTGTSTSGTGTDMNCDGVVNSSDVTLFNPQLGQGFPGP